MTKIWHCYSDNTSHLLAKTNGTRSLKSIRVCQWIISGNIWCLRRLEGARSFRRGWITLPRWQVIPVRVLSCSNALLSHAITHDNAVSMLVATIRFHCLLVCNKLMQLVLNWSFSSAYDCDFFVLDFNMKYLYVIKL